MAPGKHSADSKYSFETDYNYGSDDNNKISKNKIIIIVAMIMVIIALIVIIFIYKNNNSQKNVVKNENNVNLQVVTEKMIEKHNGYNVLGKILIKEFGVEQYILDSTEDEALNSGVIRLYGGTLNNYGNFCIAGHNKEGVFQTLADMEVGDAFTIIEPDFTETQYEIKEIYTSEADDLKCLLQDEQKIEITLITCQNGSTTRLIVKAEEISKE